MYRVHAAGESVHGDPVAGGERGALENLRMHHLTEGVEDAYVYISAHGFGTAKGDEGIGGVRVERELRFLLIREEVGHSVRLQIDRSGHQNVVGEGRHIARIASAPHAHAVGLSGFYLRRGHRETVARGRRNIVHEEGLIARGAVLICSHLTPRSEGIGVPFGQEGIVGNGDVESRGLGGEIVRRASIRGGRVRNAVRQVADRVDITAVSGRIPDEVGSLHK